MLLACTFFCSIFARDMIRHPDKVLNTLPGVSTEVFLLFIFPLSLACSTQNRNKKACLATCCSFDVDMQSHEE